MPRGIIWSIKATNELLEILRFWIKKNKSNTFSTKLNLEIEEHLTLILEFPKIGRLTDISGVFIKVINSYLVYYEISGEFIVILTIRHAKKNPKTLKLK